ncbi:PREDICTED: lysozyme C-1-like [Capra hircus]|uniref:lysozyme C-1-like n=1 Tax=Capra hircus TaxID=9925 RepID=UPI00084740F9|nr:PREDICTED: lysozyme C-1-like [Capra hircus]
MRLSGMTCHVIVPGLVDACKEQCRSPYLPVWGGEELMENDIAKAVACAKQIVSEQGIPAWVAWKSHCRDHEVSSYAKGCAL